MSQRGEADRRARAKLAAERKLLENDRLKLQEERQRLDEAMERHKLSLAALRTGQRNRLLLWLISTLATIVVTIFLTDVLDPPIRRLLFRPPTVVVAVLPGRVHGGNADGCAIYAIRVASTGNIDSLTMELDFGARISDFVIANPTRFANNTSMELSAIGADEKGECKVKAHASGPDASISARLSGPNELTVRVDHELPTLQLEGTVTLSKFDASHHDEVKINGSFTYDQHGQEDSRPIEAAVNPIIEIESPPLPTVPPKGAMIPAPTIR